MSALTPEEDLLLGKTIIAIERIGVQSLALSFSDGTTVLLHASHHRPNRMTWLAIAAVEEPVDDR